MELSVNYSIPNFGLEILLKISKFSLQCIKWDVYRSDTFHAAILICFC